VACEAPWQTSLVAELAGDLWALVKDGKKPHHGTRRREPSWSSPVARPPDFRFTTVAAVDLDELATEIAAGRHTARNATFAFDQFLSSLDYLSLSAPHRALARELRSRADLRLALQLFRDAGRVPRLDSEPKDLFLLA
jgi:hypothetical protein